MLVKHAKSDNILSHMNVYIHVCDFNSNNKYKQINQMQYYTYDKKNMN